MPSNLKAIIADPEFQNAPTDVQKKLLTSYDPDFAKLDDEDFQGLIKSPAKEAGDRLNQETQLENMVGGQILDPVTNKPGYTDDQRREDIRQVKMDLNRKRINKETDQLIERDLSSNANPITSAVMGAESVPLGMAQLGEIGMKKALGDEAFKKTFARQDEIDRHVQDMIERETAANPTSAAIGSALSQAVSMGGTGGTIKKVIAGEFGAAGKEYLKNALVNMGAGTAIRKATGGETNINDLGVDALLALIGGTPKKELIEAPESTAAKLASERPSDLPISPQEVPKELPETKLPVTTQDQVVAKEAEALPSITPTEKPEKIPLKNASGETTYVNPPALPEQKPSGFSPVEKPKNFAENTIEAGKQSLDDLFGANGNTEKLLMSAVKPSVHAGTNAPENLAQVWLPKVYEAAKDAKIKLADWDSFEKAGTLAINNTFKKIDEGLRRAGKAGAKIDLDDFSNLVTKDILTDDAFAMESGHISDAMKQKTRVEQIISAYHGKTLTPRQAESVLQKQNALLESFYNKAQLKAEGMTVEKLAKTDPEMASRLLLAQELRSKLDEAVSRLPGEFSGLKREYGVLSSIQPMVVKRKIVEERQQLASLAEKISLGKVAGTKGLMSAADLALGRVLAAAAKKSDSGIEKLKKAAYQYEQRLSVPKKG